jgi:2',3'-cyclic-nucleotide 2'-phosphodiesterase (5'-nucleotidase family)
MKLLSIIFCILLTTPAFAELIQILHTNDLHSHLEHAVQRPDLGGYARLKVFMDEQKALAKRKGIGSISMDAGDFMEGSIYYIADRGRKTFEAFDKLGHDVAILGNHDYLMGPDDLEGIFRDVPPHRPLLAANLKMDPAYTNINEHLRPVWEGMVGGVKVGVIGITTNDMLYKWRLGDEGGISGEVVAARKWAKYLRERGSEVIVALTHIGVKADKNLAKQVPEIDVIVGGHSHTALQEIVWQKTKNKRVPIVQAGHYGEWLGRLILNYDREKKSVSVVNYKLLPIDGKVRDLEMQTVIAEANTELYQDFGRQWLNEVIGKSTLEPMHVKDHSRPWHFFVNESMLEATGADFAIHAANLSGKNYPVGNITRKDLYNGNPRTFDFSDKYGYNIHTAKVMGGLIKVLAKATVMFKLPLYFSGIKFNWERTNSGEIKIRNLTLNGQPVKAFHFYRVAFSEAIVRGGYNLTYATHALLHDGENTHIPMWKAMEEKLLREKIISPDEGRRPASGKKVDRVMIPAINPVESP